MKSRWGQPTAPDITPLIYEVSDPQCFSKWETNCLTLFDSFTKPGTKLKERVDEFSHASNSKMGVQVRLGILEAFRDDFEQGFLDDLLLKVEAEVAADYMKQAEGLLNEGQPGQFDHVPAAILVCCLLNNSDIFVFSKGHLPGSFDLCQNLLSFGFPDVTLGIEVVLGEVFHNNSVNQLAHAAEAAGQDRLLAQVSEEAFD